MINKHLEDAMKKTMDSQQMAMLEMQYKEMGHSMWQQLKVESWPDSKDAELTPMTVMTIVMGGPPEMKLMESEHRTQVEKNSKVVARNFLLSSILGVTANLQLKRIPNFVRWNFILRYTIRFPLFFLPNLLFFQKYQQIYNDMFDIVTLYHRRYLLAWLRLYYFQRTGDFRYMDPHKKILQQMISAYGSTKPGAGSS